MSYASLVSIDDTLYVECGERGSDDVEYKPVQDGWESFGGSYWFALEYEDDGRIFGFVQMQAEELGYFTTEQLEPMIEQGKVWKIEDQDLPHSGRQDAQLDSATIDDDAILDGPATDDTSGLSP